MNYPPPFGNFFPPQQGGPQQTPPQLQQHHAQQQQQGPGAGIGQQQPQQQQPQQPAIDPALLQSLYPQAFQALALQQQLAAMGKGIAAHQLQQQQQAQAAAAAQQQQQHHHHQQGGMPPQLQLPPLPMPLPMQLQQHPNAFFQQVLASFPGGQDNPLIAQITQQQIMQHQHAQQMAAFQQQQQQQQQQHQHLRDKGADMYDDDYEDDDEEYEDDDAPRKRRKPKKVPTGPPAPKPPKGAPRQYVVCKDCPQCKLKVGNNCFPATDHEVLTDQGFLSLSAVRAHLAAHPSLRVACWVDGQLQYHAIGSAEVIVAGGDHTLVDMTAGGKAHSDVSLAPTTNHRMWAQLGSTHANRSFIAPGGPGWAIHQASDVLAAGAKDASTCVQFDAKFARGVQASADSDRSLSFVAALGLSTDAHVDAFLWLYGYWLSSGWLDVKGEGIRFAPRNQHDVAELETRLAALPIARKAGDGSSIGIFDPQWWAYFSRQYAQAGKVREEESLSGRTSERVVPSTASFWSWAFRLSPARARMLLAGLRAADAEQSDAENRNATQIFTSSARFRDEVSRLALHAGYTALFQPSDKRGGNASWTVSFTTGESDGAKVGLPKLTVASECKAVKFRGDVWCVSVPTEQQLIMVRRVLAREGTTVTHASRPVIVGNTRVCRGCGHVFTNVKQHSSHHQHMHHFTGPPTNPDGTIMESRRSTRKKAKYTPSNAVDYMDKDEQAQLQIALANSLVEVKTGDLSQVKDAPEYHPTVAEWKNPIGYIEKIRAEAETFGIAKIVPPAGKWNPPFKLKSDFKFPTRLQHLHKLTEAVGFEPGKSYTPVEYEAMANAFKERWVAERNAKTGAVGQPSEEELEQAYWKIVETAQPPTEIEYGNDVSNVVAGGGAFEPASAEIDPAAYAGEPSWNLNLLPHAAGSVLKSLPQSIQGITEPWLYMGMLFATFCWHTEDDYLYSMNYLHKGASKIWYSVPARKSQAFEKVLNRTLAQLIYEEPDLHLKLVTMLPPALLHSHQVPVFRTVQQPGTFIVTFPKAQHAGMSLGYNIAEAVNFASDSWFQYGREAMGRYKKYARGSVLSYSQLLFDCILNSRWKYNVDILRDELLNLYETELRGRRLCRDYGVTKKQRINAQTFEPGQELECAKCRIPLYLSFVGCPCILDHAHLIAPPRTRIPDDPVPQPPQQPPPQQQLLQHDDHHQLHDEGGPAHHGLHSHHDASLYLNPNDPHSHEHHMPQLQHDGQHNMQPHPVAAAATAPEPQEPPPPPPEPRYSSLCLCECMHQIWCLDHIRQAKGALNTDHGGHMPVLFYRHVLPELVAMDEILAQPASEDELKGKVSAVQILKERTATLELDKDELPPTPPPPAAQEFESLDADVAAAAAASSVAAPVVKPKPKKERSRPVRHASDDDEEFEPDRNADLDDEDSDDDNPPIHAARNNHHQMHTGLPPAFTAPHIMYPGMPPAMYTQMAQAAALAQQQQAAAAAPQPRSQPRRTARDAGREDLMDVELDPVPGMDDDEEEETRKRAAADINPQVRQALSAIVEAIAEVSSMKVDEGPQGMEMEAAANNGMPAAAAAATLQAAQQQSILAAQAAAMQAQAAQLGVTPAQLMQMQQAQFMQHQEIIRQQQLRQMQAGQR